MGSANVKAVLTDWSDRVRDPAFRVLVAIALTTRDEDDPPVFWGGVELLAAALGRRAPLTEADLRAVGRAMGQLRTVGAIVRVQHSAPGKAPRHELRLKASTSDAARLVKERSTPDARRPVNDGEHRTRGDHSQDAPRPNTGRATSDRGVLGTTEDSASHPWRPTTESARDLADDADLLARIDATGFETRDTGTAP